MNDNALRFRIGIFVLMSLILMAVLVTIFSGAPTLFTRNNRYVVLLNNAAGVGPGTPVRRAGVKIGEVEALELDDESGKVRVGILVERKHILRANEQPVLNRNVLGDTTIDFVALKPPEGTEPDTTPVAPGTAMVGRGQPDAQTLLNQTTELMPSTQRAVMELGKAARTFNELAPELSKTNDEARVAVRNWGKLGERLDVLVQTQQDKIIKTLEDLDDTLKRVGQTFNDDNQRNLAATLKNVRNASDSLDSVTKNTDELIKDSRKTMARVNDSLAQTDQVLANLQRTTKPMAERSDAVMKNLDESTRKLNQVLTDAQELMRAFSRGDGTIQRLMNDPALYQNLNEVTCMVGRMMPRLDRILKDFEVFADKLARHPELLGVGGAVRPSGGINYGEFGEPGA
ncbi:MAG: MlaD family protein [Gemmataceae bacterium]|nr:MlaD family protein [Gemmataceae bacterium]